MSVVLWGALIAVLGIGILPFLVVQAVFGFTLLEIVNYMEHYGMLRQEVGPPDRRRYERVAPAHSWNSNNIATNVLLYHLQRHSDHHANPTRRFQTLRDFPESPVLPTGYAGMMTLALVPPLFRRVMDRRVVAHYDGDLRLANLHPRRRDALLAAYPPPADPTDEVRDDAAVRTVGDDVAARALPRLRPHPRGGGGQRGRGDRGRDAVVRGAERLDLPRLRGPRQGRLRPADQDGGVTMRIIADRDSCEGHGMCEAMAHEYFQIDDDGLVQVLDADPPEDDRGMVDSAVRSCPVAALRLG